MPPSLLKRQNFVPPSLLFTFSLNKSETASMSVGRKPPEGNFEGSNFLFNQQPSCPETFSGLTILSTSPWGLWPMSQGMATKNHKLAWLHEQTPKSMLLLVPTCLYSSILASLNARLTTISRTAEPPTQMGMAQKTGTKMECW